MNKMTTIFCLISAAIFYSGSIIAQKVKYDDDTVKVDGKPYAIMKKKSAGPMRSDYVVSGLSGTELVTFKSMLRPYYGTGFKFGMDEELFYVAYFTATGSKAELKHYNGNGFAKLIVENNLVKGNAVDPESEKRFIQLNNGTLGSTTNTTPTEKSPTVVVTINNNTNSPGDNNPNTGITTTPKSKAPVFEREQDHTRRKSDREVQAGYHIFIVHPENDRNHRLFRRWRENRRGFGSCCKSPGMER